MENKIPTAEEFYKSIVGESPVGYTEEAMIEFAKLHVEAQTEAILKITHKNGTPRIVDVKESIIDAYPLTLIK